MSQHFQFVSGVELTKQNYNITHHHALQWYTKKPNHTSGKIGEYILAYTRKPNKSCQHEFVAESTLSGVQRFLTSALRRKCLKEEETIPPKKWVKHEIDPFLSLQLMKPYIPIKPDGSFHEVAQLNHDQLEMVLMFKKILEIMTPKDLSAIVPLHCTVLGTGGMGKSILINALTSIIRQIFSPTNDMATTGFNAPPSSLLLTINPVVYLSLNRQNWTPRTIHKMNGRMHPLPVIIDRDIYQLPPVQRMLPIVYLSRNHLSWSGTTIHKMHGLSPKTIQHRKAQAYLRRRYRDDRHATISIMVLNGDNSFALTTKIPGYRPQHDHSKQCCHLRQSCNLLLQDDRRNLRLSLRTREDISGYLQRYISPNPSDLERSFLYMNS
jgi:hypothetical protein